MIPLLFFILYSMSSPDPVRMAPLQKAMSTQNNFINQSKLENVLEVIIGKLDREDSRIIRDRRGIAIEISTDMCFNTGGVALEQECMEEILDLLIPYISYNQHYCRGVLIEGHTDSDPIPKKLLEKFPTNWELSSARASSVANYLIELGVNPGRLQASGYADRWPFDATWYDVKSGKVDKQFIIESNNTNERKKMNRRIRIVFTNK